MNYPYPSSNSYRARCTNVVDGDTYDLFIDVGFHGYHEERIRLLGVNAPELNDPDPATRAVAQQAKHFAVSWLNPTTIGLDAWPLRIVSTKTDHFGRYLADIFKTDPSGIEHSLADDLLAAGLAVVYNP